MKRNEQMPAPNKPLVWHKAGCMLAESFVRICKLFPVQTFVPPATTQHNVMFIIFVHTFQTYIRPYIRLYTLNLQNAI